MHLQAVVTAIGQRAHSTWSGLSTADQQTLIKQGHLPLLIDLGGSIETLVHELGHVCSRDKPWTALSISISAPCAGGRISEPLREAEELARDTSSRLSKKLKREELLSGAGLIDELVASATSSGLTGSRYFGHVARDILGGLVHAVHGDHIEEAQQALALWQKCLEMLGHPVPVIHKTNSEQALKAAVLLAFEYPEHLKECLDPLRTDLGIERPAAVIIDEVLRDSSYHPEVASF